MTLEELLHKYLNDELSAEELSLFREAVRRPENREELDRLLSAWINHELPNAEPEQIDVESLYAELTQSRGIPVGSEPEPSRPRHLFIRFTGIAAAGIGLVAGIFLFYHRKADQPVATAPSFIKPAPIFPAGNKAVLTLADGHRIVLDSAADGKLASQGAMQVIKTGNGQLAYQRAGDAGTATPATVASTATASLLYNEIATPRGGFY